MPFEERDLRTFLVHPPKPAKIVVHTEEGASEIIPGTGKTWASIARTIVALEANFVEVFSTDGTLARALRDDGKAGSPLALPSLPVTSDPETARLLHFANLLYRATEFSTTLAFEKMVDLFERMNERSLAIEQRLERTEAAYRRTLNDQLREAFAEAAAEEHEGPEENPLMAMARAFFEGSEMGKKTTRAPRPNGGTNGANGATDGKGHATP